MINIREYIESHLLDPYKENHTIIQETMMEIIIDKLEKLYEYTVEFPEIISPSYSNDILRVIADQFLFNIREDAELTEQINILNNILYVYNRRGSIDTIENMWKYYGGNLPKDVKVDIPSYKLFRYSLSALSGNHVFPDNTTHRTGVYEIRLVNNTYPIEDLKEFMVKELVAAGNYIYFTNILHADVINSENLTNYYKYRINKNDLFTIQLSALKSQQGFNWSGYNPLSRNSENSTWSGKGEIFLELSAIMNIGLITMSAYNLYDNAGFVVTPIPSISEIVYTIRNYMNTQKNIESLLYCTSLNPTSYIVRHLYNIENEEIISEYPGYFILSNTLLGREVV